MKFSLVYHFKNRAIVFSFSSDLCEKFVDNDFFLNILVQMIAHEWLNQLQYLSTGCYRKSDDIFEKTKEERKLRCHKCFFRKF